MSETKISLKVDKESKMIWKSISSEKKVDKRNWIALKYISDEKLGLSGSGEGGIDEAKEKTFNEEEVTFLLLRGCSIKSKKDTEPIYLLVSWIPKKIMGLKRAISILHVDDIARIFSLKFFCLVEPHKIKNVSKRYCIKRVQEIRGLENTGKCFFDHRVYDTLVEKQNRILEEMKKPPTEGKEAAKKLGKKKKGEVHVLKEILSTEFRYVRSMKLFFKTFVECLRKQGCADLFSMVSSQVNTIIEINSTLLKRLQEVYEAKQTVDEIEEFDKYLQSIPLEFFSPEKTSKIVEILIAECPSFRFYSLYVNSYPKMLHSITKCRNENKNVKIAFKKVKKELRREKERCCDFEGFLIMPIQRIPRYILLLRELLKKIHPTDPLFEKTLSTMVQIKEIADLINQNKQKMLMIRKTIHLSKKLKKNNLMEQKMKLYKDVEILIPKLISKKKRTNNTEESDFFEKSVLPGEAFVMNKSFIVVKILSSSGGGGDDSLKKKRIKFHCEIDLLNNPAVRIMKHPLFSNIFQIEDDHELFSFRLNTPKECTKLIDSCKQVLSNVHLYRVYHQRPLYKQLLNYKTTIENKKQKAYFVINADLKIKIYSNKKEFKLNKMIQGFSIINAKFGKIDYAKHTEKNQKYQERKKREASRSNKFLRMSMAEFGDFSAPPGGSVSSGGYNFNDDNNNCSSSEEEEEEEKEEKEYLEQLSIDEKKHMEFNCWFQITTEQNKVYYLQAPSVLGLETWIGILDRIGVCKREDEIDEDLEINQLFLLFQAGLTKEFKDRAVENQEDLKIKHMPAMSLRSILNGDVVGDDDDNKKEEEQEETEGEELQQQEEEKEEQKKEEVVKDDDTKEEEKEVEKPKEVIEKQQQQQEEEDNTHLEKQEKQEKEEKEVNNEEKCDLLKNQVEHLQYKLTLERNVRRVEKKKKLTLLRQCYLLKKENEWMKKLLEEKGIEWNKLSSKKNIKKPVHKAPPVPTLKNKRPDHKPPSPPPSPYLQQEK